MSLQTYVIPIPASGPGTAVDISQLLPENRTLLFAKGSNESSNFKLEVSADNTNFIDSGIALSVSRLVTFTNAAVWVRLNRKSGAGGTYACSVTGQVGAGAPAVAAFLKAATDASASSPVPELGFWQANGPRTVKDAWLSPSAVLTADGTNYAMITIRARTQDGTDRGVVAQLSTNTGSWAAQNDVQMTLGPITQLNNGDWLTFNSAKVGTGVIVPSLAAVVRFHE
ncbi:uncharacterized protein SOCE26_052800 [Sorangium cellulosum]|uniref:Uncharacterized protein n=1 Tax=Sorangium cellulosum TaxID=56 RepID=A0A2L0EX31_SORCE|nr:hypothetical protein [Sorangium cellulosum]AUX43825.1 uncharacterized protein SOCE26_052800 [Sorangium cellulosum]